MQVRLEVSHKSGKKKTVNIQSDAVIGRSTECSLRIASSEISRKHCKLTVIDSGVLVRDLESANGTWVNGKMIPPARDVALRPGSRLSIGPVQFIVHYESSNPAIDPPGSTVDLPAINAIPEAETPDEAVTDAAAADVDDSVEIPELVPAGEESDAVETVVVEPGAVQEMLADSFAGVAEEDDSTLAEAGEAVVEEVIVDVEGGVAAEVEDAGEAEAVETEPVVPADKKQKRGSMFGGLLKFGRKSKEEPATAEQPVSDEPEGVAEVADIEEAVEETAPADAAPAIGPLPEEETEYVEEGAEGYDEEEYEGEEYEDGEYEDEEYEDEEEEEVDEELGDFFSQFDGQ